MSSDCALTLRVSVAEFDAVVRAQARYNDGVDTVAVNRSAFVRHLILWGLSEYCKAEHQRPIAPLRHAVKSRDQWTDAL